MITFVSPVRQTKRSARRDRQGCELIDDTFSGPARSAMDSGRERPTERRSAELTANARALHLGIAAQMLTGHQSGYGWQTSPLLPVSPQARGAARYARVANEQPFPERLGLARSA